jgi:hypothetical protein
MLVGARVSILFVLSCYMKYGAAGREVPFNGDLKCEWIQWLIIPSRFVAHLIATEN